MGNTPGKIKEIEDTGNNAEDSNNKHIASDMGGADVQAAAEPIKPAENAPVSSVTNKSDTDVKVKTEAAAKVEIDKNVEEDNSEIIQKYKIELEQVAQKGDVNLLFDFGLVYWYGVNGEKNLERALAYFTLAAKQSHARAQFYVGNAYFNGEVVKGNKKKAAEYFALAAAQGEADGQSHLGICYANGAGVTQDYKKALELFILATKQNNSEGQYHLASCYALGQGLEINLKKAVVCFELAAKQGHTRAQYLLGHCYIEGEGVPKDIQEGIKYLQKAADQNLALAREDLKKLIKQNTTQNVPDNVAVVVQTSAMVSNLPSEGKKISEHPIAAAAGAGAAATPVLFNKEKDEATKSIREESGIKKNIQDLISDLDVYIKKTRDAIDKEGLTLKTAQFLLSAGGYFTSYLPSRMVGGNKFEKIINVEKIKEKLIILGNKADNDPTLAESFTTILDEFSKSDISVGGGVEVSSTIEKYRKALK